MDNPKIRTIVFFAILACYSVSQAAVSISDGWVEGVGARTVTESATGNQLCLVHSAYENDGGGGTTTTFAGVTWGGVAMTLGVQENIDGGTFENGGSYWYIKEADWPTTSPTPSEAVFVVTYSGSNPSDSSMASIILDGVDQTTPIGDTSGSVDGSTYGADITLGIDVTADGYSTIAGTSSSVRTFSTWLFATEQFEYANISNHAAAVGHQLESTTTTNTAGFSLSSSATRGCTVAIAITAASGGAPPPLPTRRRRILLGQ